MTDTPLYTPAEARARETFLALMWALSYPGRAHALPAVEDMDAFALIGETLLDLETSYYTPDPALAAVYARSGARALEPDRAAYHVYPALATPAAVEAAASTPASIAASVASISVASIEEEAAQSGDDPALNAIAAASAGTMLYPDTAATLVVGCRLPAPGDAPAAAFTLTGPGIDGHTTLHVAGLPARFWALRERARRYPLGWDLFLVDAAALRVVGLPRTTQIGE